MGLIRTAGDDGWAQNTPADALYPSIQRSGDYTAGEAYRDAATIPRKNTFPERGRNRTREAVTAYEGGVTSGNPDTDQK